MVNYCSVGKCNSQPQKNKISVFRFPPEDQAERRNVWTTYVRKSRVDKGNKKFVKWNPGPFACICSLHFEDSAFLGGEKSKLLFLKGDEPKLKLKDTAIPTVVTWKDDKIQNLPKSSRKTRTTQVLQFIVS